MPLLNHQKTTKMNKIELVSAALVKMAPGQFHMDAVAAECGNEVTAQEAGRVVSKLNGANISGVEIRTDNTQRRFLVSLHNDRGHPTANG